MEDQGWEAAEASSAARLHPEGAPTPPAEKAAAEKAKAEAKAKAKAKAAITSAGGDGLRRARKALPVLKGSKGKRCRTGDAKLTIGGELNAKWCIHAVGPSYLVINDLGKDMREGDALLALRGQ